MEKLAQILAVKAKIINEVILHQIAGNFVFHDLILKGIALFCLMSVMPWDFRLFDPLTYSAKLAESTLNPLT